MTVSEFFRAIGQGIWEPMKSVGNQTLGAIPAVIAAIVILVAGYLVALLISSIVEKLLNRVKFNEWVLEKTHVAREVGKFDLTHILGLLTKWYIIVLFLSQTAHIINLGVISAFLTALAVWIPKVIVAVILGLVGILAGMYVEKKIIETKAKGAKIVAAVAKWAIYVFMALIVLKQIGVETGLAEMSFNIVLGGVVLMVALIIGISFGFAFRDDAKKIISDVKKKL